MKLKIFAALAIILTFASCCAHKSYMSETAPPPVMVGSAAPAQSSPYEQHYGTVEESLDDVIVMARRHVATPKPESKPTEHVPIAKVISSDAIMTQLKWSAFGYTVPKVANIDDEIPVKLVINPSQTAQDIQKQLDKNTRLTGYVKVSKIVDAKLTARNFDIKNITPERQAVVDTENTTWLWSLKPLKAGKDQTIDITVTAIVTVDGETAERYIDSYNGSIQINITPEQRFSKWFGDNWQWLFGSFLLPAAVGYGWFKRDRKRKLMAKKLTS